MPRPDDRNAAYWSHALAQARDYCGCPEAALGLIIGCAFGWWMAMGGDRVVLRLHTVAVLFGWSVLGAVVGKVVGRARGAVRYHRVERKLERFRGGTTSGTHPDPGTR